MQTMDTPSRINSSNLGLKAVAATQTSTFGAEFTALKKAVEEVTTLQYHMRSMGIMGSKSAPRFVDNMNTVLHATTPGSTLNKKNMGL
eukprot:6991243-Ditylum_brightwellii.AAC.1